MSAAAADAKARLWITLRGAVQGVGFRPFVHRLARELDLAGWVANTPAGVRAELEGPMRALQAFLERLRAAPPPRAAIHGVEHAFLDPAGYDGFAIRESEVGEAASAAVLPDIATCVDCLREVQDPRARRHRYPFTNCTNCGPRFTIVESMPYDRGRTTMKIFPMCARCCEEYDDPGDRRFHAQPIACCDCGPQLELRDPGGRVLAGRDDALREAAAALRCGAIVAVKAIGGFHLVADARDDAAVRRLRQRKGREEKPFALLYPSLRAVREHAEVSPLEASLLASPEAPIVLLVRRGDDLAPGVAPHNPYLGIMLASNPLQHLLLAELGRPVIATSGNLSEEPIATDNDEALERLGSVADRFLMHDRPIARPVDDSIVRVVADRPLVLRRARGYAPLSLELPSEVAPTLAVGGHLKGAIALGAGRRAILSQHLGDLGTEAACASFARAIEDLGTLHRLRPRAVARDAHPDYHSTRHAESMGLPVTPVQHHHAHVLSCLADNELAPPVLGVAWDGTGYGLDGTVWGGEFLRVRGDGFSRFSHLRTFRMPGGEQAVREPRRSALGALFEIFGGSVPDDLPPMRAFSRDELRVLLSMLERKLCAPATSSAGRLFDALASVVGLCHRSSYEGQAAVALESAAHGHAAERPYADASEDWEGLLRCVIADVGRGVATGRIAARIHATLAETITAVARRAGDERVVLTGGCFQNRFLTERAIARLGAEGFRVYWHQRVPPNDGGIALGQLLACARSA